MILEIRLDRANLPNKILINLKAGSKMSKIFISFSHFDRDQAEQIVEQLKQDHHDCWAYTSDSIAGEDYLVEVTRGIQSCDVFVILITESSLESHQVSKEVGVAHQLNKKFLPILISVSADRFREHRPGWVTAFSTSVYLQWPDSGWQTIYAKLRQSIAKIAKEIEEGHKTIPEGVDSVENARKPKKSWAAEAQLIEISSINKVVHRTPDIDEFLELDGQYFITANKGFGKSLMLIAKRAILMKEHSQRGRELNRKAQVVFIPEDRPFLDILTGELPSLSSNHKDFICELRNCKRLWSFAIRLSVVSHCDSEYDQLDKTAFHSASGIQLDEIAGPKVRPTAVFQSMLFLPIGKIIRVLDEFETKLDVVFRRIHRAVYVFIDRIEEGISSLDRDGWIAVQGGLIEAAWNIMSTNSHVKVYASLREEAYANYESDTKPNLFSATLHLRYNENELQSIIERLSMLYERQGFSEFVCLKEVRNISCGITENSFRYLLRHTLGRPRDLVIICSKLSSYRMQLNEAKFREIVNETGAGFIVKNVFSEMKPFLNCLRSAEDRLRFFRLLECNVMTRSEIEDICYKFNGVPQEQLATESFRQEISEHPFCELYSCGLLGIARDDDSLGGLQQFKQPFDVMTPTGAVLPLANYYFLHPCLHSLVYKNCYGNGYDFFRNIIIGHNYPWPPGMREILQLQKAFFRIEYSDLKRDLFEWLAAFMRDPVSPKDLWGDFSCKASMLARDLYQNGFEDAWVAMQSFCESRGIKL